jgi:hypothetical protein
VKLFLCRLSFSRSCYARGGGGKKESRVDRWKEKRFCFKQKEKLWRRRRARNKSRRYSLYPHLVSSSPNFIAQLNAETAPLINDTHTSQRGLISAPGLRIPSLWPLFQIGKLWRATPLALSLIAKGPVFFY